MNTVNRGWLKKQVAAGKMQARCDFDFDDIYGNQADMIWKPARLSPDREWEEYEDSNGLTRHRLVNGNDLYKLGCISFESWDFATKSGWAHRNTDNTIQLVVHSNLSYMLRETKEIT